jgi:hypothetical protein
MTMGDITIVYIYKRNTLLYLDKQTRSHDPAVLYVIKDYFLVYRWSLSRLLFSNTKVIKILKPYL